MKEQQQVPIHTEYIQIDQLLKLEGIIETGGQIKSFIDEGILTLNGQEAFPPPLQIPAPY